MNSAPSRGFALEIEGNFAQMHIDPARLYRTEIEQIIEQRLSG